MSDVYPLFRESKVISTKDPEDLGRIQLRVYPELASVPEGDLPWCLPMASGPHDGDFSTPLEKQWVYCTVWNKYWSEISYLPFCMPDPKKPKFKDFKNKYISKVGDYKGTPDVQHTVGSILEDGFVTFHDTKESQHGILHPSGTYALINKEGEIFIKSVKKLTFHNDDDTVLATVDSESGDIELKTKGGVKKTIDKNIERTVKGNIKDDVTGNVEADVKGNWKIKVLGNADIESTGSAKIKATGMVNVESTGPATLKALAPVTVESAAMATVRGASMVNIEAPVMNFTGPKSQGQVVPSGSGVCCAIVVCPVCALPQTG
jgi:hypothetical protein